MNPPPFYFNGYAKLPYQRADGSIKLEFESLQELGNTDLAKITAWNKIAAIIAILPETVEGSVEGLLGDSPPDESRDSGGVEEVETSASPPRKGQTPSQKVRFYIRGILAQIEPDASEERAEEFYRWVIDNHVLPTLSIEATNIQKQWREITTDE